MILSPINGVYGLKPRIFIRTDIRRRAHAPPVSAPSDKQRRSVREYVGIQLSKAWYQSRKVKSSVFPKKRHFKCKLFSHLPYLLHLRVNIGVPYTAHGRRAVRHNAEKGTKRLTNGYKEGIIIMVFCACITYYLLAAFRFIISRFWYHFFAVLLFVSFVNGSPPALTYKSIKEYRFTARHPALMHCNTA